MSDPNEHERDQSSGPNGSPSAAQDLQDAEADDRRSIFIIIGIIFVAFLTGVTILVIAVSYDWIK